MEKLIEGVTSSGTTSSDYRKLFRKLSQDGQDPQHAVHHLLRLARPGRTHHSKQTWRSVRRQNVGNIVPPAGVTGSTNSTPTRQSSSPWNRCASATSSSCGHTQCGAMEALLRGLPPESSMPHLQDWLAVAAPVRQVLQTQYSHLKSHAEQVTAAGERTFCLPWIISTPTPAWKNACATARSAAWLVLQDRQC